VGTRPRRNYDNQQVLEVIRSNYDTLTLKLQDGLDQHDKYNEKPKENSFFTQLVNVCLINFVVIVVCVR
jgi:hypothetical protein